MRASAILLVLLMLGGVSNVYGMSHGLLEGVVVAKFTTLGQTGLPNSIQVVIDTGEGLYWTVYCQRSRSNLGFCDSMSTGDYYSVAGTFECSTTASSSTVLVPAEVSEI
jgi:hypothetical protein